MVSLQMLLALDVEIWTLTFERRKLYTGSKAIQIHILSLKLVKTLLVPTTIAHKAAVDVKAILSTKVASANVQDGQALSLLAETQIQ